MSLAITYNGFTCDAAPCQPLGSYEYVREGNAWRFACDLLVTGADAAELAANATALETAVMPAGRAFAVSVDGAVMVAHDPAAGTGRADAPKLRKIGHADDAPWARVYRLEIAGSLPLAGIAVTLTQTETVTQASREKRYPLWDGQAYAMAVFTPGPTQRLTQTITQETAGQATLPLPEPLTAPPANAAWRLDEETHTVSTLHATTPGEDATDRLQHKWVREYTAVKVA